MDGLLGQHHVFDFDESGTILRVHYGWVRGTTLDEYSITLSHELVESITDPEMDGVHFVDCTDVDGTCEIGDVCNDSYNLSNGTAVQEYYSAASDRCIRPGI